MLGFRNRVFSLMCVLFASCTSFPTAHANEGTLNRSSNPDALKMILQEIQSLRKELEVLQKQVERLSDAVAESKKNPDGNAKPRPVITQKARPLKEFSIGSIHPDDVKSQSLAPIESPGVKIDKQKTIVPVDSDIQPEDIGILSSKGKKPKNMGDALEAIGHHIIEGIELEAKPELLPETHVFPTHKVLSGTHFEIVNTQIRGSSVVEVTILNVGNETGYNVRCHVLARRRNNIIKNEIIDKGIGVFNNGEGISPGQYSKTSIKLFRKSYDWLDFKMFWDDKPVETEFQVDQNARFLRKIDPKYPEAARRASKEAVVIVEFTVGVGGKATDIEVAEPKGFGFDEASIEAIKQWRFAPAIKDGVQVPVRVKMPITFSLR